MKEPGRPPPSFPPHHLARISPRGGKRHREVVLLSKSRDRCRVDNEEEDEDDGEERVKRVKKASSFLLDKKIQRECEKLRRRERSYVKRPFKTVHYYFREDHRSSVDRVIERFTFSVLSFPPS